ncbi:pilus assembly protein PilB [Marinobacteraceae bacterium S3BR75-40.1]
MKVHAQQLEKSRLGRLLVNRGYITEGQLQEALSIQRSKGERLGEILIASGVISARDLKRTLKHQQRYRYAAAFAAMATAPLQPLVTFAASTPAAAVPVPPAATQTIKGSGLQPMTDGEMQQVTGRGTEEFIDQIKNLQSSAEGEQPADAVETLKVVGKTFMPILAALDYDLSITGVHYRDGQPLQSVSQDGRITLALPERIEQVSLRNIRVGDNSPSMGHVFMTDISFSAGSKMTIYAH